MNVSQVDLSLGAGSVVCGALIGQSLSDVCTFQKLKAIEELKEQQASGKVLQKNQVMFVDNPTLMSHKLIWAHEGQTPQSSAGPGWCLEEL